jgi:hypothetical protein
LLFGLRLGRFSTADPARCLFALKIGKTPLPLRPDPMLLSHGAFYRSERDKVQR